MHMLEISNFLFACYPIFVVAVKPPFVRQSRVLRGSCGGSFSMPMGCTSPPHDVRQGSVLLAGPAEPCEPLW